MLLRTQPDSPACGIPDVSAEQNEDNNNNNNNNNSNINTTNNTNNSSSKVLETSKGRGDRNVQLDATVDRHGEGVSTVGTAALVYHELMASSSHDHDHDHDHNHDHDHHSSNRTNDNYNLKSRFKKQKTTGPSSTDGNHYDDRVMMVKEEEEEEEEAVKKRVERLSTPDRGRIMVARSRILKGTFLYRVSAQAIVCDSENRTQRCASCLKRLSTSLLGKEEEEGGMMREGDGVVLEDEEEEAKNVGGYGCKGCAEIWYCDEACAERDWEELHAAECRFLKALYQGVPTVSSFTDSNNSSNRQEEDKDETAWMSTVGDPYRKALTLFSQVFEPYTQDYCRTLIRTLTHRFHELTDPFASQRGKRADDLPYLTPIDLAQAPGPLPYSEVEDLVANQESFSRERIEGELGDVVQVLDAFQTHLEVYYSPLHQRRYQHQQRVGTEAAAPRRLPQKELLDLIMREECNSFGLYEYPPLPSLNSTTPTSTTTTTNLTSERNNINNNNNAKTGYALGLFVRHHLYGFNHSCSPNLFHVAHNNHLLFYAGRDILPGEEINITYLEFGPHYRLPVLETAGAATTTEADVREANSRREAFETRKGFLKGHFYFDCGCARCAYETAYYSCDNQSSSSNNNATGATTMTTTMRLMEGLSEEDERFLREGLSCERGGCFGFYAPPTVLRARHDNSDRNGLVDDDEGRWGCVACGYRQSS